jgi:hypothetical protein
MAPAPPELMPAKRPGYLTDGLVAAVVDMFVLVRESTSASTTEQARWWGKSGEIPALTRNGNGWGPSGSPASPGTRSRRMNNSPPAVVRGPESGRRAAGPVPDKAGPERPSQ